MQIHQIATFFGKKKKRVGRGGKRGGYSGKGQKGQKSRAGHKMRPQLRDIIKKIPKKRGYRFTIIKPRPAAVNLETVSKFYREGEYVTPKSLFAKGIVRKLKGSLPKVKILAVGELRKKVNFSKCEVSSPAKEKIEKAGGTIK